MDSSLAREYLSQFSWSSSDTTKTPSSQHSSIHQRKSSVTTPGTQFSASSPRETENVVSSRDTDQPSRLAKNLKRTSSILSLSFLRSKLHTNLPAQEAYGVIRDNSCKKKFASAPWKTRQRVRVSPPIPPKPEPLFRQQLLESDPGLRSESEADLTPQRPVLIPQSSSDKSLLETRKIRHLADLDPDKRCSGFARIHPEGWGHIIPKQWMEDQFSDDQSTRDSGSVYTQDNGEEDERWRRIAGLLAPQAEGRDLHDTALKASNAGESRCCLEPPTHENLHVPNGLSASRQPQFACNNIKRSDKMVSLWRNQKQDELIPPPLKLQIHKRVIEATPSFLASEEKQPDESRRTINGNARPPNTPDKHHHHKHNPPQLEEDINEILDLYFDAEAPSEREQDSDVPALDLNSPSIPAQAYPSPRPIVPVRGQELHTTTTTGGSSSSTGTTKTNAMLLRHAPAPTLKKSRASAPDEVRPREHYYSERYRGTGTGTGTDTGRYRQMSLGKERKSAGSAMVTVLDEYGQAWI